MRRADHDRLRGPRYALVVMPESCAAPICVVIDSLEDAVKRGAYFVAMEFEWLPTSPQADGDDGE